jgi:hypothetical protein
VGSLAICLLAICLLAICLLAIRLLAIRLLAIRLLAICLLAICLAARSWTTPRYDSAGIYSLTTSAPCAIFCVGTLIVREGRLTGGVRTRTS